MIVHNKGNSRMKSNFGSLIYLELHRHNILQNDTNKNFMFLF